jgi:hypothetical protein
VKPNINSVEVHPQPSNNEHPVDGALVGAGSLWPKKFRVFTMVCKPVKVLVHPRRATSGKLPLPKK